MRSGHRVEPALQPRVLLGDARRHVFAELREDEQQYVVECIADFYS